MSIYCLILSSRALIDQKLYTYISIHHPCTLGMSPCRHNKSPYIELPHFHAVLQLSLHLEHIASYTTMEEVNRPSLFSSETLYCMAVLVTEVPPDSVDMACSSLSLRHAYRFSFLHVSVLFPCTIYNIATVMLSHRRRKPANSDKVSPLVVLLTMSRYNSVWLS